MNLLYKNKTKWVEYQLDAYNQIELSNKRKDWCIVVEKSREGHILLQVHNHLFLDEDMNEITTGIDCPSCEG